MAARDFDNSSETASKETVRSHLLTPVIRGHVEETSAASDFMSGRLRAADEGEEDAPEMPYAS
jgi:hypothetical protein